MTTTLLSSGLTDEQYALQYALAIKDIDRGTNLLHMQIDLHHKGKLQKRNRDYIKIHILVQDIYDMLYHRAQRKYR